MTEQRPTALGHYALIAMMVGVTGLFLYMVRVFFVPALMAAVFAGLFYPVYRRLDDLLRGRSSLAAILVCLAILAGLLVPVYIVADQVGREAVAAFDRAGSWAEVLVREPARLTAWAEGLDWLSLTAVDVDVQRALREVTRTAGGLLAEAINTTSRGTFYLLANLFVTFFAMFYFFRDGARLLSELKYLSPLDERYETILIERFVSVSRATVKGSLLVALLQGTLGGLTLWAFGFPSPVLWGVVMTILAMVPLVGTWMVLYPAAIWDMAMGHWGSGIAIALLSTVVISSVDNVVRPWLVGRDTGMHSLFTFFSTVGGIAVFGVMGFVLGPIIAAMFLAIVDFYKAEFSQQLEGSPATGHPVDQAANDF